jgi:acetyltransferase-like isoleucine patch superfamily enzyme
VINEGAIVGAAAVVDFEVPPFAVVAGNPARVVGSASG